MKKEAAEAMSSGLPAVPTGMSLVRTERKSSYESPDGGLSAWSCRSG